MAIVKSISVNDVSPYKSVKGIDVDMHAHGHNGRDSISISIGMIGFGANVHLSIANARDIARGLIECADELDKILLAQLEVKELLA